MSSKDLIEQLRKATGVGRWTRAMLTAADRLEANDAEIAELRQHVTLLRDALSAGAEYAKQVLNEFDHAYRRHDAVEQERKIIYDDVQLIQEALAATEPKP